MYVRLTLHESIIARIISERVLRSKDKAAGEKLTGSLRSIINQFVITSGSLCERALGRDGVYLRSSLDTSVAFIYRILASRPNCALRLPRRSLGRPRHVQVQRQRGVRHGESSGGHAHRLQQQRARRRSSQQQQRAEHAERQSQQCSRHHQGREDCQSRR